jgi:chloramphenicol 3-O-phosphotransferase
MRYGALLNNWEHGGHPLKEQKDNIRACRFRLVGVELTLPGTTTARKRRPDRWLSYLKTAGHRRKDGFVSDEALPQNPF